MNTKIESKITDLASDEEKNFTDSLEKLQYAANEISRQTTSLEDSLKLFENGMKEAKYCNNILEEAKQKIEYYKEENHD